MTVKKLPRRPACAVCAAVAVVALLPPAVRAAAAVPFDLSEATIADLQGRMESGKDTARSLTQKYLARIQAVDRRGPALRSVIELNPDALAIAERLDAERRARGPRGPLHGIPILIKDNLATTDRMGTTAGSLALEGAAPPREAFVAQRLREAGAVILGKTNLSEWANFRSTHSVSGWSARGGQTRNPYALDRNPSGSSSGSGAATAANLCAAAVGTETDGSIVAPASATGVVGLKPTLGLVSRAGIIPIAHSQDTAGPMARTVRDAALLLGAMTGADPADPATSEGARPKKAPGDYTSFLDAGGLKGARIGVVRKKLFGYSGAADQIAEAALAEMKRLGAVIVDPADIPTLAKLDEDELEVLLYEFKTDLNQYLSGLGPGAKVHSLTDVIEFNQQHRERELPWFGQEILLMAQKKGPLTTPAYRAALGRIRHLSREAGIDLVMDRNKLDALVAPTTGPAILTDPVNGDLGGNGSSTIAAVAGYPHITVPAGQVHGLPVGLSFIGRAFSEPTLLRLAYAFEQATRHRRPPSLWPTADLSRR